MHHRLSCTSKSNSPSSVSSDLAHDIIIFLTVNSITSRYPNVFGFYQLMHADNLHILTSHKNTHQSIKSRCLQLFACTNNINYAPRKIGETAQLHRMVSFIPPSHHLLMTTSRIHHFFLHCHTSTVLSCHHNPWTAQYAKKNFDLQTRLLSHVLLLFSWKVQIMILMGACCSKIHSKAISWSFTRDM